MQDDNEPSEPIANREMFCTIPCEEEDIFTAVRYNDLTMIVRRINAGFHIDRPHADMPGDQVYTLRHMARMARQLRLRGYSLMHVAVAHAKLKTIQCLLEQGACVNVMDENRLSPLGVACAIQRLDVVKLLLRNDADPNIQSVSGETPLIAAVRVNNLDIVQSLLSAGAQPDLTDYKGATPLLHCLEVHRSVDTEPVARALVQGGCQVDTVTPQGASPLMTSVAVGRMDIADLLLTSGADITRSDKSGRNVFSMVAGPRSALYLIHRGAGCDQLDNAGRRPLDGAIANSDAGMIRLLLSADVPRSTSSILEHPRVVKLCEHLPSFKTWLTGELGQVRNLKRLCRQSIRTCLSPAHLKDIDCLPIPRLLKDFLFVKDFDVSSFRNI